MAILNIGKETIVDYLKHVSALESTLELTRNSLLSNKQFALLQKKFAKDQSIKRSAGNLTSRKRKRTKDVGALPKDSRIRRETIIAEEHKLNIISQVSGLIGPKEKGIRQQIRSVQIDKQQPTIVECSVPFSRFKIGKGNVKLKYKNEVYLFRNNNIQGFNEVLNYYYNSISQKRKNKVRSFLIKVAINKEYHSFEFIDFNLYQYVLNIKESFLPADFKPLHQKERQPLHSSIKNRTVLGANNIEFFDGYYVVTLNNSSISPLKVIDTNSYSCLRHVHRFFTERFPKDSIIEYTDKEIIGVRPPFMLSHYVRVLHDNMDMHGEWWEEVQNERRPSLSHCRKNSDDVFKRITTQKNSYLVNLAAMQNDQKLIVVYEINHGQKENAFIFTAAMPNDRCAVIFENVSTEASTATEIFITKKDNYESCVNLVFDYFTDYSISNKRDSLRRGVNPPRKFNAEQFYSVVHGEWETWLAKMSQLLERTENASEIEFKPGLNVPHDIETRSGNTTTNPKNIHNELMRRLYSQLCEQYGTENVGTEIRIGSKRIDVVAKTSANYDIYEIKSDPDPFACVTIALGQICQYAYLYCRDKIGKMVIAGATKASPEIEEYLAWFREKHSLEVYYMNI